MPCKCVPPLETMHPRPVSQLSDHTRAPPQIWHHATVMPLFWSLMNARITNHFTLVLANTFTHVFVYGYFTASILKVSRAPCDAATSCATLTRVPLRYVRLQIEVWFKPYITLLQISQFVFDMLYALPWP